MSLKDFLSTIKHLERTSLKRFERRKLDWKEAYLYKYWINKECVGKA